MQVAAPPPVLTGSGLTQRGGGGAARGAVVGPIAVGAGGCARRRPGLLPFLSRTRWGRRRAQVRAARGAVRPGTARRGGGREKGAGRSRPVEPPLYPARRRCVTQRCERACVSCRGASTAEGCRGPQGFHGGPEGLAVERGKRCVEDGGASIAEGP